MRHTAVVAFFAVLGSISAPTFASPIVEPFDTETSNATDGSYPAFALNVGSAQVSAGSLRLGWGSFLQLFSRPRELEHVFVSGRIQSASFGEWQVGMQLGNRGFSFHPGYPGGSLLILDLATRASLVAPIGMGFTPSATAFHTMSLSLADAPGHLTIRVEDGEGIEAPFVFDWLIDSDFDATGAAGFLYYNDGGDGGEAAFDDLRLIPEPSSGSLVAAGVLGFCAWGRRPHTCRIRAPRVPGL